MEVCGGVGCLVASLGGTQNRVGKVATPHSHIVHFDPSSGGETVSGGCGDYCGYSSSGWLEHSDQTR